MCRIQWNTVVTATLLLLFTFVANGFVISKQPCRTTTALFAKKKKKKSRNQTVGQGGGFAKLEEEQVTSESTDSTMFQSVETAPEQSESASILKPTKKFETDPSLPPEERAKQLLREQYGLKSLEEQQTDRKKRERMEEERKKRAEWKKMAENNEDFDIMAMLPAPVLIGIDRFLKIGVAVSTTLFIAAGIGITAEAWSAASGSPLPPDIDEFIVNVVEPNFTPGLLVLLGFSVSLGIFASLQLGSDAAQYKEDK